MAIDFDHLSFFNRFFIYDQNMQKDEQLNRLRDANLQLRSQIFELNQDVVDLMEIVEIQKNRRSVSHKNKAISSDGILPAQLECECVCVRINKRTNLLMKTNVIDLLFYRSHSNFQWLIINSSC